MTMLVAGNTLWQRALTSLATSIDWGDEGGGSRGRLALGISREHLAITEHARVETAMESVSTDDVIAAGSGAEVVEEDRGRPQGVTKVVLGYSPPDEPLHLVVNVDAFESDLARPPGS